ncbi:MAG: VOC family protein [Methanomethylovorans sp.]|nr:VOC family protein [Methanomethylovorans sp.]
MNDKITPHLWFEGNAQEAVEFYLSAFSESRIKSRSFYPNSADEGLADFQLELAGKVLTIDFELGGQPFTAINAGPEFKFNPSISFMLNFDPLTDDQAQENLDELWQKLGDGGRQLMPLQSYPFSKRYGWVEDRYGLSWQLILTDPEGEPRPFIVPSLMFAGKNINSAEEVINFYVSVFGDAEVGELAYYPEKTGPAKKGALMFGDFRLTDQWFAAMDAGGEFNFIFNEAISFMIQCKDQAEIDYFWEKLSSEPEYEQCGWCKDKYGLSWQITPENMPELMDKPHAFANLMQMKKIVIADF